MLLTFKKIKIPWALAFLLLTPLISAAQTIVSVEKISKNQIGVRGNDDSASPAIGANRGRVVFQSKASNLVQGDGNDVSDIFLKRGLSEAIIRISETPLGIGGNGRSTNPSLTPTSPGRFFAVLFESVASNLVRRSDLSDTNGVRDIFMHVPTRNFTERVSVGPELTEANGASSEPSATLIPEPNRVLVAYSSLASNLTANDSNGVSDIFLATIVKPTEDGSFLETGLSTMRVSAAPGGNEANGASVAPRISKDGSVVVFESDATNLVEGIVPSHRQIYLYRLSTGAIELVSKSPSGVPGDGASSFSAVNFSGNVIAYATLARNILNDSKTPAEGAVQIVRYDVRTGQSTRVNVAPDGTPGNGTTSAGVTTDIDASGRFISFSDSSSNLVASDTNEAPDIFLSDTETGSLIRVSESALGIQADRGSAAPVLARGKFNADNLVVLFSSNASTLIPDDAGNSTDVFATTLTVPPRPLSRNTTLEVPPDTELSGEDATFTLEEFSTTTTGAAMGGINAQATRRQTFYDIRITREGRTGRAADNRRKISKRNAITFKRLKSGTYTAKYRVVVKRGTRVVSKTTFSPPQRFSKDDVESEEE
jgi:hypothetical protein